MNKLKGDKFFCTNDKFWGNSSAEIAGYLYVYQNLVIKY